MHGLKVTPLKLELDDILQDEVQLVLAFGYIMMRMSFDIG
jgi:hypothetical protein